MKTFLIDDNLIVKQTFTLNAEESHHAIKVMRCRQHDTVRILNGKGQLATAEIIDIKELLCVKIIEVNKITERSKISIGLANIKKRDRMEWFLEKAVECGIDSVFIYFSKNTEKSGIDLGRLNKIAQNALKQSGNVWMPKIELAPKFEDWVKSLNYNNKFIAYCPIGLELHLQNEYCDKEPAIILIGPEGDFTPNEVDVAIVNSFKPVSLGKQILRAETAALYALITANNNNLTK